MSTSRITREELYYEIARSISKRSTCKRAHVGAVLVRDNHILGVGYNGAPRDEAHCSDVGCDIVDDHCVRTVHAEINAILNAARNGVSTEASELYCTHRPCFRCMMLLKNSGIKSFNYEKEYRDGRND